MTDWLNTVDTKKISKLAHQATENASEKSRETTTTKEKKTEKPMKPVTYLCRDCTPQRYFTTLGGFTRHNRVFHRYTLLKTRPTLTKQENDYVCPDCKNRYTTKQSLTRHIKERHTPNILKPSCSFCGKWWHRKQGADYHIRHEHLGNALITYIDPSPILPVGPHVPPMEARPLRKIKALKPFDFSMSTYRPQPSAHRVPVDPHPMYETVRIDPMDPKIRKIQNA